MQIEEALRMQKNPQKQKQNSSCHTVVKNHDQERLYTLKTASDFSTEILKARRTWDIEYLISSFGRW